MKLNLYVIPSVKNQLTIDSRFKCLKTANSLKKTWENMYMI